MHPDLFVISCSVGPSPIFANTFAGYFVYCVHSSFFRGRAREEGRGMEDGEK